MHLKAPFTTALFLSAALCTSARQIEVTSTNHHVLYDQTVTVGYEGISITSEFPVSSLRYNDHQYLSGGTPISESEMVIAVTSDCSEEQLGGRPIVSYGVGPTQVSSIKISLEKSDNATTADIDDLSFLDTSLFQASWSYESYWCNANNNFNQGFNDDAYEISKSAIQDESMKKEMPLENASAASGRWGGFLLPATSLLLGIFMSGGAGGRQGRYFWIVAAASIAILMVNGLAAQDDTTAALNATDANATSASSTPMVCKINVEILHDGCRFDPLTVSAPAARVADVVLQGQESAAMEEGSCTTLYNANLVFPKSFIIHQNSTGEHIELPQVDGDLCYRMVEGRPFIDQSGTQIQASASSTNSNNGWCTSKPDNTHTANQQQQQREALGQEWTRRALGEHASVSSFAAFTIALMSNNAPPQLVQDSLTAAADEVRHAKVSFDAASKFLGKPVEPGPLPASSHKFEQDLQALALATAQEGCIDETLSALLAALEVDELLSHQQQYISEEERQWLKDQMWAIALEEASHSALAWRTIRWICDKDSEACVAVKSSMFDAAHLQAAVQKRLEGRPFSLEKAQMAWEQIHNALIPLVTEKKAVHPMPSVGDGNMPLTNLVTQKIIDRVVGSLEVASQ